MLGKNDVVAASALLSLAARRLGALWTAIPFLAGCIISTASVGAERPPYKVGWVVTLSGVGSANADGAVQGIRLALDQVNTQNLAGRKIELTTVDDASDPRTAQNVCQRLVLEDKVDAIIGEETTPARIACYQAAKKAGIPYIITPPTPGGICDAGYFVTGQEVSQSLLPLANYALKKGLKKIYYIGSDYAPPHDFEALLRKRVVQAGGSIVGVSYEPLGTADFAADISKIVAAKPDAVLSFVVGNDNVTLHQQYGSDPRTQNLPILDGVILASTITKLGGAGKGIIASSPYFPSIDSPANRAFTAAYVKKYGRRANPDAWGLAAYNSLRLLASAVKKAGSKPADVIKAMETESFDGPNGRLKMEHHYAMEPIYIGVQGADHTIKIVDRFEDVRPVSCSTLP